MISVHEDCPHANDICKSVVTFNVKQTHEISFVERSHFFTCINFDKEIQFVVKVIMADKKSIVYLLSYL